MTPAEFCIRRPVATVMIFVSLFVLGAISTRLLQLEMFPDIDAPFVGVQVPYPGSTPGEVERLITRPLEEAIGTVKGVLQLRSNSGPDGAFIAVLLNLGESVPLRAADVREQVDRVRAELPGDVRHINVLKFNLTDQPMLTLRISSERDLSESYEMLTRNLVRPIERVPGVARVQLQGVEPREIRIELIANKVEALGVELNQLNQLLMTSNFAASGGLISEGNVRYRVNPVGEFRSVDEVRQLVVDQRGTRLADIANITFEPQRRDYERHLGQAYAIGVQVFRERGANLVDVSAAVLGQVDQAQENQEMAGIRLFFLEDQAAGVTSSMNELLKAGGLGALMSIILLYLFLRNIRTTLVVALSVPISLTMALGGLYMFGYSLNIMTMMGLLLAIGMLVDNAVVVSESIFHERELDPHADREVVAMKGIRAVGLAVLAGTLTSMAVFLPNLFGQMNQIKVFLGHMAVAVCLSLFASLLIAQTLIPMMAARMTPPSAHKQTFIHRLKHRYERFLRWSLGHRKIAWLGILAIVLSGGLANIFVDKEFFPEALDRDLDLQYNLDRKYTLDEIRPAVDKIETYLYQNQQAFEIRDVYTYFNEDGEAQSRLLLTEAADAIKSATEIRDEILEGMPKIAIGRPTFESQRIGGAEGVSVMLIGDSSEVLVDLSANVITALGTIDGLSEVKSEASAGDQEIAVRVDRERAIQYGFSTQEVASAVAVALRGTQLSEYRDDEGEVPLTLRFAENETQRVDQLASLKLQNQQGQRVALSALVNIGFRSGPERVLRVDQETALTLQATLKGQTMDQVRPKIEAIMNTFTFPTGYSWKLGRGFDTDDDSQQQMFTDILLAILFIYIIMAALFESLIHPLTIVTGIVFSIIGVLWFFALTGTSLSLMAFIGILVLIGVVVNNGIVMVDHINQLRRAGMLRVDAVVQGGRDRLRPILMTVATTVLGLLPLCFGITQVGGGGPPYFPMARAIVGGLVFSTVVSLCLLPTIYVTMDDLRLWGRNRWRAATSKPNAKHGAII